MNRQALPYINEAGRILDEGIASPATIDAAAKAAVGVGLGPFEVMNLVGTRVMASAIRNLSVHGPLYEPSATIQAKGMSNTPWTLHESESNWSKEIEHRLLGAIFVPALEILHGGLASADDLNFICKNALGYPKGSEEWMSSMAPAELNEIVQATCDRFAMRDPRM